MRGFCGLSWNDQGPPLDLIYDLDLFYLVFFNYRAMPFIDWIKNLLPRLVLYLETVGPNVNFQRRGFRPLQNFG